MLKKHLFIIVFIFIISGLFAESQTIYSYPGLWADYGNKSARCDASATIVADHIYKYNSDIYFMNNNGSRSVNLYKYFTFYDTSTSDDLEFKFFSYFSNTDRTNVPCVGPVWIVKGDIVNRQQGPLRLDTDGESYLKFHIEGRQYSSAWMHSGWSNDSENTSTVYTLKYDGTGPSIFPSVIYSGKYFYNGLNRRYWYKPGGTFTQSWGGTDNGGAGIAYYYLNGIYQGLGTSSTYSGTGTVSTNVTAYDHVGNGTPGSAPVYYEDSTSPLITIDSDSKSYNDNNENGKYTYSLEANAVDNQSGVNGKVESHWISDSSDEYLSGISERISGNDISSTSSIKFINFSYNEKYYYYLDAIDHVTNKSSPTGYEFFGLTAPPQGNGKIENLSSGSNPGFSTFNGELLFNKDTFSDEIIGLESLSVDYGTGMEDIAILKDTQLVNKSEGLKYSTSIHTNEDGEETENVIMSLDFPIPWSSITNPHKIIDLTYIGNYYNGHTNNELTHPFVPQNIPLSTPGNDFSLRFFRDSDEVENLHFLDIEDKTTPLFFIDNFQLELEGKGGVGKDIEGDLLYLNIHSKTGSTQIPCNEGLIYFDKNENTIRTQLGNGTNYAVQSANGSPTDVNISEITGIEILEKFKEDSVSVDKNGDYSIDLDIDKTITCDFDLTITTDVDFYDELINISIDPVDTENHTFVSDNIISSNDGSFQWNISYDPDFTDSTGIQKISFFEYDNNDGSLSDDNFLAVFKAIPEEDVITKEFELGDDYKNAVLEESLYTLNEQAVGTASLRRIGVYIQDFAGHYKFMTQQVYYDKASPTPLDPNNGVISWFAEGETGENLEYDSFANDTNKITLSLDLADFAAYGSLEACKIEASTTSSLVVDGTVSINEDQSLITIPIIDGYPSDQAIDLKLVFTDYAGNVTENNMTLYTPIYFPAGAQAYDYIAETDQEWDDEAETNLEHYLGWQQIGLPENKLVLYYDVDSESTDDIPLNGVDSYGDFIHSKEIDAQGLLKGIPAHAQYNYYLHGRNRSGYESKFTQKDLSFSRRLKNNTPSFTSYAADGSCEFEGESYIGPLNDLTFTFVDHDETDDFILTFYINGTEYSTEEIHGSVGQDFFLYVGDYFPGFVDDKVYTISYKVLDHWDTTGDIEEGVAVPDTPHTYRYDSTKPDLANYQYDRRDGFSSIYGDIHLDIKEDGSGLIPNWTLYESEDGSVGLSNDILIAEGDNLEGFTHHISQIPEIENYTLYLKIEDGVGNTNIKQIGPFTKDVTSPSITDTHIDGDSTIFSRPSIPIQLSWSDNLSGASRILYQFTDGSTVLKDGAVSPSADQMEDPLWSVICSLSGTQIVDTQGYTLRVKVLDNAGNGEEAPWKVVSNDILIDSSSPVVKITGQEGFSFNQGQYYLGGNSSPSISYEVLDSNPSGDVWYELNDEGEVSTSTNLASLFSGLTDGQSYSVRLGTKDKAGNIGRSSSFSFLADSVIPDSTTFEINITNHSDFTRGQQVRFTLNAEDQHSGVDKFFLWVGSNVEGEEIPVISSLLPGHLADGTVPITYVDGKTYSLNLPQVAAGNYFFKVSAVDYAGNRSSVKILTGETLKYIDSTESLAVNDYSVYTNDAKNLSAWWEYQGEKEFNHYAYRVIDASNGKAVSDWEFTFKNYGTVSFPDGLDENGIYYFEVYTGFGDGSRSASSFSPGCYIDLKRPSISTVSIPTYGTLSDLKVSWDAEDGESAIGSVTAVLESYQMADGQIVLETFNENGVEINIPVREELGVYSLGSGSHGEDVQVLQAEDYESLSVADGQRLMVTLRASDLAGNITEIQAPVFIKDSSAPPVPVVLDSGDYVNPDKNHVHFDWMWSKQDVHSGNVSYEYQVLLPTDSIDDDNWKSVDGTSLDLPNAGDYENGSQVVLALQVTNGAGLTTIGYSNGIVLDNTKPAIADVKLLGADGEETHYLLGRSAGLSMVSEDDESGVSKYRYEPGRFNGTDWVSLGDEVELLSLDQVLPVTIPDELDSLEVIYYRATAYNAAGESSSLPGYTSGAKLFEGVPLVENVIGETINGDLQFQWDVEDLIPLKEIILNLVKNGMTAESVTVDGNVRSHVFSDLADGYYQLQIDYKAVNSVENGEPATSGLVCLDTTAPIASDLDYTRFVNDKFKYSFNIKDNLTGSGGYRYRIGPAGSPDLLTQGWLWKDSSGSYQERTVSFENDFAGGYDCLEDGGTLLFSFQMKDRSGNWSDVYYSHPILVDRTAPEAPVVDKDRQIQAGDTFYTQTSYFILKNNRISGIQIDGEDKESGITAYRWAVREKDKTTALEWSETVPYQAEENDLNIELKGVELTGCALSDKVKYEVYIQLVNGSGILSEPGVSPLLLADFSAPTFEVLTSTSGLDTESVEGQTGLIYNAAGDVNLRVLEEDGEVLKLTYSLIGPDAVEGEATTLYYLGPDVTNFTIPFSPEDELEYGRYKLKMTLSDAGGYEGTLIQDIRLNSPPDLALLNVVTHPMEPFSLDFSKWVSDMDEITNISITLDHGGVVDQWDQVNASDLTNLRYDHSELFAGRSEYTYHVAAQDIYGQKSEAEAIVIIVNTSDGTLYTNEYWTGTHQINGPVIVPSGLSLYIDDGSLIQIVPMADHETPLIQIDSGGVLDHVGRATYELMDRTLDFLWEGIKVFGDADLDGITVKDARRGVSLFSSHVTEINNSTFMDNQMGLHLYGTSPTISGCSFLDNQYYGIKEDEGSTPVVTGNLFSGNGYDYYDLDLTVLNADGVNNLDGNSGNRGEN